MMKEIITVRKIALIPLGNDEKRKNDYTFIRDSQYAQYIGLNKAMSYLMTAYYENDRNINTEGYKEKLKALTNTNPIFDGIEFGTGIDSKSAITKKVKSDFKIAIKNGLAKGERSINNYKRTFPLMTRGRNIKIFSDDTGYKVKWVNKITFGVILGKNKKELSVTLNRIIDGIYKLGQCSLTFEKNKLMLIMTISMKEKAKKYEPVEGRTLGVDLGIKYPVYMCLSDDTYVRKPIGSINDFLRVREQMRERRRKLSEALSINKGGRGRKKKLQSLDKLSQNEANFVQTYNHVLSKRVVTYALQNKCEYINLEKLTKDGFSDSILGKWSYYQLQKYIEYKAEREGIKVRYINPAYTSQKCSNCGYTDKENRVSQEKFVCKECGFGETHGFKDKSGKIYVNADHNAAINIARSE